MKVSALWCLAAGLSLASAQSQAGAFVHLFEWKWTDVAQECEQFLGPKGYSAVQVSPPNEHIQGSQWWTRYQPVSYQLESRGGSAAQFQDMVNRCKAAGVDVYVDAVINHTAAGSGTGVAGSSFDSASLSYPAYSSNDFHSSCDIQSSDYANDAWRVQNCRLVGLPDLNTASNYVQQTIANYLNGLTAMGVAGFRIDAAKHMAPSDLAGVYSKLNGSPLIFQEVIDLGGEAVSANDYTAMGKVTEFRYSANIGNVFRYQKLSYLSNFGSAWGFVGDQSAVVFTDNHDNQRGHGAGGSDILTYKDGSLYTLANVFMLAYPYGYPKVMSSFYFTDTDAGPGGASVWQNGQPSGCYSTFACEHRWRPIANMVGFRNATDGGALSNWWDNGNNQVAFGRSGKGFVVINREGSSLTQSFSTGMSDGSYCNVIKGDPENGCLDDSGNSHYLTVSAGQLTLTVPAMDAVAIYQGAGCSGNCSGGGSGGSASVAVSFSCNNGTTYQGQSVYVVGDVAALGGWDPAAAVKLSPTSYPTWTGTINLPSDTAVAWKCLKREEADPNAGVQWQGGDNNSFNTGQSQSVSAGF
ncbi:MAG: carbohydrate-binding module family 20 domain-containing protein [Pseudomonadota bacterium]|uniref:carbohydrate-binding module family 20 domain-containing protein n=1 Tax=Gallaecimonas pentaromativorans TaxID=584787 RepID=UPI00067F3CD5|nr:carbohydrate-binding module family 20 domain-containing protein [Gallaecimonas pentaromativorans]MED5526899.1 carbohydrate-binding module family 20 domain-containing protein [Pseudomonadota bacterium]